MREIQPRILGESVIQVGETDVTPSSTHLFALLLVLAISGDAGISRQELQELLFGSLARTEAAHRLRQLLYRLRRRGVELHEEGGELLRLANPVIDWVDSVYRRDARAVTGEQVIVLPHYAPSLSSAYADWVESTRDALTRRLRDNLLCRLRRARDGRAWADAALSASLLHELDPMSEEVAVTGAEALSMLGRRDEALSLLDRYLACDRDDEPPSADVRRLRQRILKSPVVKRQARLMGRSECLAFLEEQRRKQVEVGGHVALVLGPPGMGKSRVAEEFVAHARMGAGRVLHHRCEADATLDPYQLFVSILPELMAMPGSLGASPQSRSTLQLLLSPGEGADAPVGAIAVDARRSEIQRAIIDLLEAVSMEQRLIIVVDDAHLLDSASLEVLRQLAHRANQVDASVILFSRVREELAAKVATAPRGATYVLPPLDRADCEALLAELRDDRALPADAREWVLDQAAGNPFYLYAFARHDVDDRASIPSHIRALASNLYLSLSGDARLTLETCLLLDAHATLERVSAVTQLKEPELLQALRQLEELDVVRYTEGSVRGPHALLHEALRALIPTTVSGMLHRRIAVVLSADLEKQFTTAVALLAVRSWLAAGDALAAARLALQCARDSAALAEPRSGALLLASLPMDSVPVDYTRVLLDELIALAGLGNEYDILFRALGERIAIAQATHESEEVNATLLEQQLASYHRSARAMMPRDTFRSMLGNHRLSLSLRARAATRLLAVAYLEYDHESAEKTYRTLTTMSSPEGCTDVDYLKACLVYHTSFGSARTALSIADLLLARFPSPAMSDESRYARNNVAFSWLVLGVRDRARSLLTETYEYMLARGAIHEAEYAASLLGDMSVADNDIPTAELWLQRQNAITMQQDESARTHSAAYHSTAAHIAIAHHEWDSALEILDAFARCGISQAPRHLAVSAMLRIQISLGRQEALIPRDVAALHDFFERGASSGNQDDVVYTLCVAYEALNRGSEARQLLSRYLSNQRRECAPLEPRLRALVSRWSPL